MKKHNVAAAILFCGFLFTFAAGYLLLPKSDFSEMEKRYLAEPPKVSLESVFSGQWSTVGKPRHSTIDSRLQTVKII